MKLLQRSLKGYMIIFFGKEKGHGTPDSIDEYKNAFVQWPKVLEKKKATLPQLKMTEDKDEWSGVNRTNSNHTFPWRTEDNLKKKFSPIFALNIDLNLPSPNLQKSRPLSLINGILLERKIYYPPCFFPYLNFQKNRPFLWMLVIVVKK